jgi:hypothetical protein
MRHGTEPSKIKIASSLEVPATCSFFLCVWAVLRLVLALFGHLRMKTFCLGWILVYRTKVEKSQEDKPWKQKEDTFPLTP